MNEIEDGAHEVLLAPYLLGFKDLEIGPWSFLGFDSVEESSVLPKDLREQVLALIDAYSVSAGSGRLGAVVYPTGSQVGGIVERSQIPRLQKALLAGTLSNNPELAVAEESANGGHMAMAAENALVFGHPLNASPSYVISTGVLIRQIELRSPQGTSDLPKIHPPSGLPTPMLSRFDNEMAVATFELVGREANESRRLSRALDWYALCFSNANVVSLDARVLAYRCALEVLTGSGDETKRVVRAVENLLLTDEAEVEVREPSWAKGPAELTADGWWISQLSDLRNAIAHGDEVPEEMWFHEGFHQLDKSSDVLIRALRTFVAQESGDPELRRPLSDRVWGRAYEAALQDLEATQVGHLEEEKKAVRENDGRATVTPLP